MRLCSIASGSSGNCIYVGSDNTHLLVDVGISGKRVEQGLNSLELTGKDIDGILITHEHSDHIKGLGVIARKHQIPVYATEGTVEALSHMNLGKIPEGIFREIHEDEPFEINDLTVNPFTIPHDAAQPVGYQAGKQHAGHGSHRTLRHGNCKCSDNASVPEYGLEIIQRPHPRPQIDAAAHIVFSFIKSPYNNKPQRIGHNKNENYHYNNINHIKWLNPANLSFLVHTHPAFLKKVLFRLSY